MNFVVSINGRYFLSKGQPPATAIKWLAELVELDWDYKLTASGRPEDHFTVHAPVKISMEHVPNDRIHLTKEDLDAKSTPTPVRSKKAGHLPEPATRRLLNFPAKPMDPDA